MRTIRFVVAFVIAGNICFAQKTFKFEFLKIEFKHDKTWANDGFGAESPWEAGGSSVCDCSGMIVTNDDNEKNLRIVIYPSTRSGLDSLKRKQVWHYEFVPVDKSELIKTPYFNFTKKTSVWKNTDISDPLESLTQYEVWQFTGEAYGNYYIIYAFAENADHPKLKPYEEEINKIIYSMKPMK
ncbi:MAG: hypothetical protein V4511_03255 [Bacteroidota bacterium]